MKQGLNRHSKFTTDDSYFFWERYKLLGWHEIEDIIDKSFEETEGSTEEAFRQNTRVHYIREAIKKYYQFNKN